MKTENKKQNSEVKKINLAEQQQKEALKNKNIERLQFITQMVDKANLNGSFTLQESTNLGLTINDLMQKFKA